MSELFERLLALLEAGEKVSLTTVISRTGSVPCPAGSRLLVPEDGSSLGTVGGGILEAEALRAARKALQEEQPAITDLEFEAAEAAREGMLCGGRVGLYTEVVFPTGSELENFRAVVGELGASRPVAMATAVVTAYPGKAPGTTRVIFRGDKILAGSLADPQWNGKIISAAAGLLDREDSLYLELESRPGDMPGLQGFLVDPLHPDPTLVIFGAGHVAQPLCRMASLAGFRVVVVDDRGEFASRDRFPESSEILVCGPAEAFGRIDPGPGWYLVSVTRGHLQDREVVERALEFPVSYLGMIGSRRKVKLLWEDLRSRGVLQQELERVHAPVGLEIGAETPAEIAVSILAQMIATRRAAGRPVIRRGTVEL
ncbi:MAG: XdhC family protein [Candidatus Glassbacteria bacterium]|nr:XdhC family protein [Candidatus Glassbacteria bacterium]